MKKTTLTAMAFIGLGISGLKAQNLQIGISGGYGVGLGSMSSTQYNAVFDNTGNITESYNALKNDLGRGMNIQISGRYMFSENLGMDLGLAYFSGSTLLDKQIDGYQTSEENTKLTMYRINPSLILATDINNIQVYSKLGLAMGTGHIDLTSKREDAQSGITTNTMYIESGGFSLGLQGGVGIQIPMSDNLKLSAEINYLAANYAPSKGEITKYDANGTSILDMLNVSDKQVNFVDSYTANQNGIDKTKPDTSTKTYTPIGNVGLQIGLVYSFN